MKSSNKTKMAAWFVSNCRTAPSGRMKYRVVPVTYGLGHELSGAPKEAYIDVFDFPDVKSLANYLLYLQSNDTAYNEYFRWKQFYEYSNSFDGRDRHCKICEMLVKGIEPERKYPDVEAWVRKGQCINEQNKTLKNFIMGKPNIG
ncbi:Glycosyl transferase family 10 [Trinorchestia longiramus]|nr:Glycosyl transferase family 10 [Trinorchestia longiramus]